MVFPLRDDLATRRYPLITLMLIVVNAVIWLFWQPTLRGSREVELGPPGNQVVLSSDEAFIFRHAAISCELRENRPLTLGEARMAIEYNDYYACGDSPPERRNGDDQPLYPGKNVWLAALASMFLHGSALHVFGNMLVLWIAGNNIEDRLGHVRFLIFYLFCGVAAQAAHTLAAPNLVIPDLGASGAVAGMMGAYLLLFPWSRLFSIVLFPLPIAIYLPAFVVLAFWFAIQFTPLVGENVAAWAHIGGFIAGVLGLPLVLLTIRPKRLPPEERGPVFVNP